MVTKKDIRVHSIKRYGWVPDLPDARDHLYAAPVATMAKLPAKVDLRPHCPPVYDQGQLGSCTGNAIAGAVQFDREKQKLNAGLRAVPPVHLLRRAGHRGHRRHRQRRADPRRHQGRRQAGRPAGDRLALRHQPSSPHKPPPKAFEDALKDQAVSYSRVSQSSQPDEGMPGLRLPLRVRLHRL